MEIIPAVLTHTKDEFISQLTALSPYYNRFQIDIADGRFVPNTTLELADINQVFPQETSNIQLDFHLMVQDYNTQISQIKELLSKININTVFIHATATTPEVFQQLLTDINDFNVGLVLNPEDSVNEIARSYPLRIIKAIQVMTIHPGFQEQSFIPETLKKIQELREHGYTNSIYIDGGINEQSLPIITSSKYEPDFLCIGSYLTHHLDLLKERIDNLKDLS